MSVVHKFHLVFDTGLVRLPRGAKILHFGAQADGLFVWALVDPTEPAAVEREYLIFGTGHPVPDNIDLVHRATVAMENGLVWHIFEDVPF